MPDMELEVLSDKDILSVSLELTRVFFVTGEGEGEVRRIRLIVGDVYEDLFF